LEFSGRTRAKGLSLPFEMAAQALNQDLSRDDRRDHPRHDIGSGNRGQVDVAAADNDLVDQRVELAAEWRILIEEAREIAVEGIRGRGQYEYGKRPRELLVINENEDAYRERQPGGRQGIRHVPEPAARPRGDGLLDLVYIHKNLQTPGPASHRSRP